MYLIVNTRSVIVEKQNDLGRFSTEIIEPSSMDPILNVVVLLQIAPNKLRIN